MPAQRQTNQQPYTAHLAEARDEDGVIYPATAVDPGEAIDWPQQIAGFTGWAPDPPAEPEDAEPEPAAAGKGARSRSKATETQEATA